MLAISITNSFLISSIVSILVLGIVMNIKYTKRNIYRNYLVALFGFWAAIMLSMFIKFHIDGSDQISYNHNIGGLGVILMGIPCFLTLVSYPIVILNSKLLQVKWWLYLCSPMLAAVALYFIVTLAAGENPSLRYSTPDEFIHNITSLVAISRLILITFFALYITVIIYSIWRVVPLYNDYVHNNIADSDCNVDWLRECVKYIGCVTIAYFVMLFSNSQLANMFYLTSVVLLFSYMVDRSLFHRSSEDIEALIISWDRELGWHVVEDEAEAKEQEQISEVSLLSIEQLIEEWMVEERPYTRVDFTTKDIIDKFPSINYRELGELFKSKGDNFQSYVRHYRIERACEMLQQRDKSIYPKQIFNLVGFSHYSSFSRSFLATMGVSPTEYLRQIKEERASGETQP